jgi:cobalt-precorrin-5B (C1)-methyltransferase
MMTHWTRSKVDPEFLALMVRDAGGGAALCEQVASANTARHAYELWEAAGLDRASDLLCERAADNLARYAKGRIEVHVGMVDFDGSALVGASPGARAALRVGSGS